MGRKLLSTEEWFELCKSKRKDKGTNLSLTENSVYKGKNEHIELECTKHHIRFSYLADSLVRREAMCPECSRELGLRDGEGYIKRARKVHGDKYEYPNINEELKTFHSKITIKCPKGHIFKQDAQSHLSGCGCKQCSDEGHRKPRVSLQEYVEREREKYGDKYDLSRFIFQGMHKKATYICHCLDKNGVEHGEFQQTPSDHLNNKTGCPKCGNELISQKQTSTTEEFISKAKKRFGDLYNYDKVDYKSAKTNVILKCNSCGNEFVITPDNHLRGEGCPKCNRSILEVSLGKFLSDNGIEYVKEYKDGFGRLRNDFYIEKYNCIVECQGGQHFYNCYFGEYSKGKSLENLDYIIKCDTRKNKIAKDLGIRILYYTAKKDYRDRFLDSEKYNYIYTKDNLFTDMNDLLKKIKNVPSTV